MNTVSSTKGTGHRLGLGEIVLFVLGLVVVVAILGAVLYVSAPASVAPAAPAPVQAPGFANDAKDPHMIKNAFLAAAEAKRAYAQQRRGEWDAAVVVAVPELLQDHPRGEWAGGTVPVASTAGQDALQEHRRGEWMISDNASGQGALEAQRKGEWTVQSPPTAQDAYQAQRKGEQGAGNRCHELATKAEQAVCLGIR